MKLPRPDGRSCLKGQKVEQFPFVFGIVIPFQVFAFCLQYRETKFTLFRAVQIWWTTFSFEEKTGD
jgi:hypothetical protein